MRHYIISRINVNYLKNVEDPDTWFDTRFEFLEKITAPSIRNQTCENFLWLWCVAPNTKEPHMKKLEALKAKDPRIRIVTGKYPDFIREDMDSAQDYVLTTRLDSDDALGLTFVEAAQKIAIHNIGMAPFIINFSIGAYYFHKTGITYTGSKKFVNQFVSLFERSTKLQTVHCKQHGELDAFFPMVWTPTKDPMWAWVIHDTQITGWGAPEKYLGMLRHPKAEKDFNINKFIGE